jgi:hypothetical protein
MLLNSTNISSKKFNLFRQVMKAYELTVSTAFGKNAANFSEVSVGEKIFSDIYRVI